MAAMASITAAGKWRVAWEVGSSVSALVPVTVVEASVVGKSGNATVPLLHRSPLQHVMSQTSKVQFCGWLSNHILKFLHPTDTSVVMK